MAAAAPSPDDSEANFDCNICLCTCVEPVVTRCGHMACWPCLFKWLQQGSNECPVCRAFVTKDNVIPLYGRGRRRNAAAPSPALSRTPSTSTDDPVQPASAAASAPSDADSAASASAASASAVPDDSESIPDRPAGQRPQAPPRGWGGGGAAAAGGGGGGFHFMPGAAVWHNGNASFSLGFGLVPAVLSFMMGSMHNGPLLEGQEEQSKFGQAMLIVGLLAVLFLIYA